MVSTTLFILYIYVHISTNRNSKYNVDEITGTILIKESFRSFLYYLNDSTIKICTRK